MLALTPTLLILLKMSPPVSEMAQTLDVHSFNKPALTPFHADDSNGFHTSNTTRSTRAFGYTYPELLDWNMNTSVLTFDVKGHVNTLYGPIPTTLRHKQRRSESRLTVDEMSHDYSINVVVNGYAVP